MAHYLSFHIASSLVPPVTKREGIKKTASDLVLCDFLLLFQIKELLKPARFKVAETNKMD